MQARREASYPSQLTVSYCAEQISVLNGRTISDSIDVGRVSGFKAAAQSPPFKTDMWEHTTALGRGNYTITLVGGGNCYHGQIQLYLDDQMIGEVLDWYCAVTTYPFIHKVPNVHIAQSGSHSLRGEVVGKFKKSQDYWICLTEIQFQRDSIGDESSNIGVNAANCVTPAPRIQPMDES
jgi:hypothetical protein